MLRALLQLHRSICLRMERYLPNAKGHTYDLYPKVVAEHLNTPEVRVAVDVGGGKTCAFAEYRDPAWYGRIVAVDIAPEELRHNSTADARLVADVTRGLPFPDGSIDLIASRSVLEHLDDLEAFLIEANRAMRPGAYFIHWIPCKFAPFAIINQILPHRIARKLLFFLQPQVKGICGFPAVYDRCYPSAIERLLGAQGFEVVSLRPSYYQSSYFSFFVPAYLISSLYEIVLQSLRIRNLCAHALVVARKNKVAPACREIS